MTRIQRIVLRHQIHAARLKRLEILNLGRAHERISDGKRGGWPHLVYMPWRHQRSRPCLEDYDRWQH